ncbi:MAG: histone deacetylase family protein [Ectothiorhodospiraceae bacterium]|nr:histone deacetylase family protein [Ectothiorhodospiraceae bacterium]
MRIFHTDQHRLHAPRSFLNRGRIIDCPETPRRADLIAASLRDGGHRFETAPPCPPEAVRAVHDGDYLRYLEHAHAEWQALGPASEEVLPNVHPGRRMHPSRPPRGLVGRAGWFQADCACPIGAGTWEAVLASAGLAVAAADAVAGGVARATYALCRPPGHHAYADMAGGFCYLNNSALAAERLRAGGADRVAIVDVDVHHGNGTQGVFYERGDVLTVSLHGDPAEFYPFYAGYADETGAGRGAGCNVNLPLPRGTGDDRYLDTLEHALEAVARFRPQALVVALGLDASHADPLAFLAVSTAGFHRIGARLAELDLPTVLIQEGGYVSPELGANAAAVIGGFEGARTS